MQDNYRRGSLPLKKRKVSLDCSLGFATEKDFESSAIGSMSQHTSTTNYYDETYPGVSASNRHYSGLTCLNVLANASHSVSELNSSLPCNSTSSVAGDQFSRSSMVYADRFSEINSHNSNREDDLSLDDLSSGQDLDQDPGKENTKTNRIGIRRNSKVSKIGPSTSTIQSTGLQDKRYSGADGEVRCFATTTRGRACAYCCVNGAKYCHLHTDYETNPPPRRSSKKAKSTLTSDSFEENLGDGCDYSIETSLLRLGGKGAQLVPNSSPPSLASDDISRLPSPFIDDKQQVITKKRRATASKLAAKHANSEFPLLSMISTEQWFNQEVRIAAGPLVGTIGKVEKWGNGWVSVNVPGIGLHNRRSFELCLHTDQDETAAKDNDQVSLEKSHGKQSLLRVVSRDGGSPVLYPLPKAGVTQSEKLGTCKISFSASSFSETRSCDSGEFDLNSRTSPLMFQGFSTLNTAPHVTPLPTRETQQFGNGS
jgi:hypothetical protein